MLEGYTELSGTPLGFLFFGFSFKHLFFKTPNYFSKQILNNSGQKRAFYCEKCGDVLIKGEDYIPG